MFAQMRQMFLSPYGRINRTQFCVGLGAWFVFYVLQALWFANTGTNQFNFILAMFLLFLNLYIIFCVYGKRLHDFGRTRWPLVLMFVLVLISAIFVMLNFGGLEYFETLNQNPEFASDPEAMKKVTETYQASLAEHVPQTRLIVSVIPVLFTLWVALRPGEAKANKYGDVLSSFKS